MVIVPVVEAQEVYALFIYWEVGNTPNIKVYVLKGRLEGAIDQAETLNEAKALHLKSKYKDISFCFAGK